MAYQQLSEQQWIFKRNCSFTPKQVGLFYLSQLGFALFVALFFYVRGIWIVLPFTIAVLFILAIALLIYARHATDFESISIDGSSVNIFIKDGLKQESYQWNLSWIKIHPELTNNGLICITYQGLECELGRYIHVSNRPAFLDELKGQFLNIR